jgi:DNA-3-methyladenine glycosylase I
VTTDNNRSRCPWAGTLPRDALMVCYHDEEWGRPLHDDRALFELLILEGAQAGLSWSTVLNRREGYRSAYAGFEIERVAAFGDADVERLLSDAGIIRNRAKVVASIGNARGVLALQSEFGSFDRYLWDFVGGRPLDHAFECLEQIPAKTAESESMSRELQKRGFRFVGPTICYAFMQAAGLVNDHLVACWVWQETGTVEPGELTGL